MIALLESFLGMDANQIADPQLRDEVLSFQKYNSHRELLDNPVAPMVDRVAAYLAHAALGRKRYRPGEDDIPTLTRLGQYLHLHHSNVSRMATGVKVDREKYNLLLCLAAIYPAPKEGQSPREARLFRLQAANAWLDDDMGTDISLLERLHTVIEDPGAYDLTSPRTA